MKDQIKDRQSLPPDDICICGRKIEPELIPYGCLSCQNAIVQKLKEIA